MAYGLGLCGARLQSRTREDVSNTAVEDRRNRQERLSRMELPVCRANVSVSNAPSANSIGKTDEREIDG